MNDTTKPTMSPSHPAPPRVLDTPLEVGPDDWQGRDFYYLMTALVIPRPIGWISTISANGVRNIAPYSYFNLMGSDPFYCAFGSTGVKDSLRNLREVPQFVANIVTMDLLEKMNFTSGSLEACPSAPRTSRKDRGRNRRTITVATANPARRLL